MKYIPAEKLIAEIERRIAQWQPYTFACASQIASEAFDRIDELKGLLIYITSLQQEQQEGLHFTPLNRLIQKIPSEKWNDSTNNYAKKLRDCPIKEGYLKDASVLQGYISYMNGNNVPMATMDEQKQPEVDIKKEVKSYIKDNFTITDEVAQIPEENRRYSMWEDDMRAFAKHFFELGRINARKEE